MNGIDDETLNQYIDGDIKNDDLKILKEKLKNSEADRKRLSDLQNIHDELKKIRIFETSVNFTEVILGRLQRKVKTQKNDKIFIISIFSIFILLCLMIVGYLSYYIITVPSSTTILTQKVNLYITVLSKFSENSMDIFSSKNISIFGSIVSFCLLAAIYTLYAEQKFIRKRLKQ